MYISHNIIHRWAEASVWTKRLSIFSQFSRPQNAIKSTKSLDQAF